MASVVKRSNQKIATLRRVTAAVEEPSIFLRDDLTWTRGRVELGRWTAPSSLSTPS
jgi:hypothetical protein